jgi:hypothetical protein
MPTYQSDFVAAAAAAQRELSVQQIKNAFGQHAAGVFEAQLASGAERYVATNAAIAAYSFERDHVRNRVTPNSDEDLIELMSEQIEGRPGPHYLDLADELLRRRGVILNESPARRLEWRAEPHRAFTFSASLQQTTSDFPSLATAATAVVVQKRWLAATSPMKLVSRRNDRQYLGAGTSVRVAGAGSLERIYEAGALPQNAIVTTGEPVSTNSYGRVFAISRPALVSNLESALNDVARFIADACAQLESDLLFAALSATMSDGKTLFHADHGNLAASGAAPSTGTISVGVQALLAQRDASARSDGPYTGDWPRFLVCGSTDAVDARAVVSSISAGSDAITVLAEPRIGTGRAWYLFQDPAQAAALEWGTLIQNGGPLIRMGTDFRNSGFLLRAIHDVGAGAVDHRPCFKNAGS